MRNPEPSQRRVVAVSVAMFAVASLIGTGTMLAAGVRPGADAAPEPEQVPAVEQAVQVRGEAPAALSAPQRLLEDPGKEISVNGAIAGASPVPWPMGCGDQTVQAVASLSRSVNLGQDQLKVTVASYAPGAGAAALVEQRDGAPACGGGASAITGTDAVGVEHLAWSGQRAGAGISGSTFRIGDVLVHVSGPAHLAGASVLSATLDGLLDGVCATPESVAADQQRNPLAPDPEPYSVPEQLSIEDPGLPQIPSGAGYGPTAIPASLTALTEAAPMDEPDWPVWPPMPEPADRPEAPVAPQPEPTLSHSYQHLTRDVDGPGCGWSWTGQAPSLFDEGAAQRQNAQSATETIDQLRSGADQWAAQVLAYWQDADRYQQQAEAWNRYAAEVDQVNSAWAQINVQWEAYQAELATYEAREAERTGLQDQKQEAQSAWEDQLGQCAEDSAQAQREHDQSVAEASAEPSSTPSQTPSTSGASPSAAPSPSPSATVEAFEPVDCQQAHPRPAVLDAELPESLPAPTEPADPRPASAR